MKPRRRLKIESLDIRWLSSLDEDEPMAYGDVFMTVRVRVVRSFDFYRNGVHIGRFDTSEQGLMDFWRAAQ
jgi:hypothetical protein